MYLRPHLGFEGYEGQCEGFNLIMDVRGLSKLHQEPAALHQTIVLHEREMKLH